MPSSPPLDPFIQRDGVLYCEDVALPILADMVGTPAYVYSLQAIISRYRALAEALSTTATPALICYSVKANACRAILAALAAEGAGADIVSGGELLRALAAGVPPSRIVFAGVGKTAEEHAAALEAGVLALTVESTEELLALEGVARARGSVAPVALRLNPDLFAHTHRHLTTGTAGSKFGLQLEEVDGALGTIAGSPALRLIGFHVHIGSQLTRLDLHAALAARVVPIVRDALARGHAVEFLDVGGGLGVRYGDETNPVPTIAEFGASLVAAFAPAGCRLVVEPGRALVAEAGVLLARLLYRKPAAAPRHYVLDGGMSELIRPALYDAYHRIVPVVPRAGQPVTVDVVGPVCESADVIGANRTLPPAEPGDVFAIMTAGAYGYTQASTYNSRPRPPEVLVSGGEYAIVRPRERMQALTAGERVPGFVHVRPVGGVGGAGAGGGAVRGIEGAEG